MRYSFVVPIYNDGALAKDFLAEMQRTFRAYLGTEDLASELEVVFVDDGSQNDSPKLLREACDAYPFAKMIVLARNFGQHIAISAGYRIAVGDAVGMMNVDQEDPPDQLPLLLDALRDNPDVDMVGGLYAERRVPLFTKLTSYLFHTALNKLTGYDTPINSSTVRVMRRAAVDAYNALPEKSRYIPGLEMWLGLRYARVPVRHQPRQVGRSSYNFRRRLRMAIASIVSFSDFPLRLAVKLGMAIAAFGVLLVFALLVDKLFFRDFLPGYFSTVAAIVLLGGTQVVVTGIASLYIGRILAEVQGRPLFVLREVYGDVSAARLAELPPGSTISPRGRPPGTAEPATD
jgi:dolichol-phosphate mannosyltransferase